MLPFCDTKSLFSIEKYGAVKAAFRIKKRKKAEKRKPPFFVHNSAESKGNAATKGDRIGQDSMLYGFSRVFVAKKVLCATKKLAGRRELVAGLDTLSCARRKCSKKPYLIILP